MATLKRRTKGQKKLDLALLQQRLRQVELSSKGTPLPPSLLRSKHENKSLLTTKELHDRVRHEFFLETETARRNASTGNVAKLTQMHNEAAMYQQRILAEQKRMKSIATRTRDLLKQLQNGKTRNAIKHANEQEMKLHRLIQRHENLLDNALIKFHEASSYNNNLKDSIDYLRRERQVFESFQLKRNQETNSIVASAGSMIEETENLRQDKERKEAEMNILRQLAAGKLEDYEKNWAQLILKLLQELQSENAEIQQVSDVADAISARSRSLGTRSDDFEGKSVALHQSSTQVPTHEPTLAEEGTSAQVRYERLQHQIKEAQTSIGRDSRLIDTKRNEVDILEKALKRIQEATKMADIDEMVKIFVKAEEENFALYKLSSSMDKAVEEHHDDIAQLKAALQDLKIKHPSEASNRARGLEDLANQLHQLEESMKTAESVRHASVELLNEASRAVQTSFERLGKRSSKTAAIYGVSTATLDDCLADLETYAYSLVDRLLSRWHSNNKEEHKSVIEKLLYTGEIPKLDKGSLADSSEGRSDAPENLVDDPYGIKIIPPTLLDDDKLDIDESRIDVPLSSLV